MESNDRIKSYLKTVCEQIRCKKVHENITQEITDHIEDQAESYVQDGIDQETAIEKAIASMGDPVLVGGQLDRAHRPKPSWTIMIVTIVLIVIGLLIQSLLRVDDLEVTGIITITLRRFIKVIPFAIGAMLLGYFLDYTIWSKYPKIIFSVITVLCLLITWRFLEYETLNGSYPYVYYFILLFVPAYAGIIYSNRNKGYLGVLLCGIAFLIPGFIALTTRNAYAFMLIAIINLSVLTLTIAKGWFHVKKLLALLMVWIPTIAISVVFLFTRRFYYDRFVGTFLKPSSVMAWVQYTIDRALLSAKFIGKASDLNNESLQAYLETKNSGFEKNLFRNNIITNLILQYGYFIAIVIMLLLVTLTAFLFYKTFKIKNALGFVVSLSITLLFTIQIITFMLSDFGIIFFSNYELPLMTPGDISLLTYMFFIGILLSIFKYQGIYKEPEQIKAKPHWNRFTHRKSTIQ